MLDDLTFLRGGVFTIFGSGDSEYTGCVAGFMVTTQLGSNAMVDIFNGIDVGFVGRLFQ